MSDDIIPIPRDSYALIKKLDEDFSRPSFPRGTPLEDYQRWAGKRDLINELVEYMNEDITLARANNRK